MKKELEMMTEVAEKLDWGVTVGDGYILLRKFSPAGQDFTIEVELDSLKELVKDIDNRCEGFDCSTAAYEWLDSFGHGVGGAPHDMIDVYRDMEACLEMMEELHTALKELDEKIDAIIDDLAGEIPTSIEEVREAWEKGDIHFFFSSKELKAFMKAREDKETSLDVYQLDNKCYAVDVSLLGRRK